MKFSQRIIKLYYFRLDSLLFTAYESYTFDDPMTVTLSSALWLINFGESYNSWRFIYHTTVKVSQSYDIMRFGNPSINTHISLKLKSYSITVITLTPIMIQIIEHYLFSSMGKKVTGVYTAVCMGYITRTFPWPQLFCKSCGVEFISEAYLFYYCSCRLHIVSIGLHTLLCLKDNDV